MSDDLRLADLDVDGALEESIAALHGDTRATFLRRAVVGGALLLVGVVVIVLGPRALTRLGARRQSSKRSSVTPSAP